MTDDRETRIRERAYAIWLRDGAGHGSDEANWYLAAAEIDAEGKTGRVVRKKRTAAEAPDVVVAGSESPKPVKARASKPKAVPPLAG